MSPPASFSKSPRLSGSRAAAYQTLIQKSRRNIADLITKPTTWTLDPDGDYSRWADGFFTIGNWTTSFFTGMALISWIETENDQLIDSVLAMEPLYQAKVGEHAADTMHDLGFLYSLYSVALYKLTGDPRQRALGLRAADVFADRYIPDGGYLRAWGRMDEMDTEHAGIAIIDCMMNLPLLFWASEETGDPRFKDIAIRHSDTTLERFMRDDDSVFHAYRFDPATGAPLHGDNYCGHSSDSHWSRGTAWAIYGFAMSHRYTGDRRYMDAALRLSRKFISLLDEEIVPIWDFRAPLNCRAHDRDSSAAAIAACGFQEIEAAGCADDSITHWKNALIDRLCSDDYFDSNPAVRGALKHGSAIPDRSCYTSWGDYFLMEALARENGVAVNWW
jgi:unsaturated chondroitin disaccharide hydrolase